MTRVKCYLLEAHDGDRLRTGVDRGVEIGVEFAERNPGGFANRRLNAVSLPSGTVNHRQKEYYSSNK